MLKFSTIAVLGLVAALAALPAEAQQADQQAAPPPASPSSDAAPPAGIVPAAGNPNLAVAAVRMENGVRVSKVVGSAVYSDQNERIGSVDDLMMAGDDKVTMAIVSVGGFLGLGSKLVAVPFDQLKRDADHVVLPNATKDTLNAMPNFVY